MVPPDLMGLRELAGLLDPMRLLRDPAGSEAPQEPQAASAALGDPRAPEDSQGLVGPRSRKGQ
ncbi:hypothetical protein CQW39_32320 [Streptomyces griseofuscus]|uniref:Uncharacterized protein n=1 Tax=Streptomyces griseofuscus TaxID=146922 RepID=A0A426S9A3_9ACTN|nr:hypothetical protein CQW39_32320 [Streptomyces griseofuscus]RRQ86773.1 hypothetical protein CQW44_13240 [Streptomyces griseofuscus]